MTTLIQLLVNGLLLGGVFAIISIGLSLIFGVVKVVNFAHGAFLMVALYIIYLCSHYFHMSPYIALFPATVVMFGLGALTQKVLIERLLDAGEEIQIFATVGILTLLVNLALLIFGADVHVVPASTPTFSVGSVSVVSGQALTLLIAILLTISLHFFMHRTYVGRALRAVSQQRYAAQLMGVNVKSIYVLAFGMGCAFLGVAGGLLASQYPVFPTVGSYFLLTAFVVVVLGGLGSIVGALIGALIIGVIDVAAAFYISPTLQEAVSFVVFLLILVIRPNGLFGITER